MAKFFNQFTRENIRDLANRIYVENRQRWDFIQKSQKETHALLSNARYERLRQEVKRTVQAEADRSARREFCKQLRSGQRSFAAAVAEKRRATIGELDEMSAEFRAAATAWRNRWPSRRPPAAVVEQSPRTVPPKPAAAAPARGRPGFVTIRKPEAP